MNEFKQKLEEERHTTTSYMRDFNVPYPSKCPPKALFDNNVNPLFNHRPVNDFYMVPSAAGKFMDDHISRPNETRQRINFFRQIRFV